MNLEGKDRLLGCLLGGAVGDALGAAVEFLSLTEIRGRFGDSGIRDYAECYGRRGALTDDTQMTLFTAEGLIRAYDRGAERGIWNPSAIVHDAYLRWLVTQGCTSAHSRFCPDPHGGLVDHPDLHHRRAPGTTCLSALTSDRMGDLENPINNSKGCGGVMRVAPAAWASSDPFRLGAETAAITHGHPSGYLAAGALAAIIAEIARGADLPSAIEASLLQLKQWPGHEETSWLIEQALSFAESQPPTAQTVEALGQGWVADEALGIGVFCSLVARDFEEGVVLAVNHGGDSDSTGAITGNILGTLWGWRSIPERWLAELELREVIEETAHELWDRFGTG